MDEYKRRRRRSRAVMSMFLDSLGGSIDNVDVATFDSDGSDLKALVVGIEPVQSGTGEPSPDNVRPISGRSSVNVIVSPTLNPLDGTITNIPLGTTVYGGQLDVLTGVLTVDRAYLSKRVGDMNNADGAPGWRSSGVRAIIGAGINGQVNGAICSAFASGYIRANTNGANDILFFSSVAIGKTQTELIAEMPDFTIDFVIPLATPQTIQLTGQQIATFLGTNNVWCDSGKIIHLEY